ncbi:hypothetical protein DAPPUDRAFT_249022 [Daphnia pulex]|uniref:Uncharacterized protein n=1 Tax=Daphnia pulex TaxID=6669 RepID=E9GVP4_DAPPU|nr:hypothetical protein DAPPUDRAFT_249022 [Daphnia pulex]|eukprot:EFX76491.1 hypothetical protein DAPPUDRAFT_249022 [Daphnia pulex]
MSHCPMSDVTFASIDESSTCRPVCMSFTFEALLEGRGEHYVPIPSNVNLKKGRPVCIFFTLEGHIDHNTHPQQCRLQKERLFAIVVKYVVVLMLGVVSARSTTGVLMSSGSGGCETATPHVTTPRPPSTTPPSLQIITPQLRCPSYYTEFPKNYSSPSYAMKSVEYYTEPPNYYTATYHGREKAIDISRMVITDMATSAVQ